MASQKIADQAALQKAQDQGMRKIYRRHMVQIPGIKFQGLTQMSGEVDGHYIVGRQPQAKP